MHAGTGARFRLHLDTKIRSRILASLVYLYEVLHCVDYSSRKYISTAEKAVIMIAWPAWSWVTSLSPVYVRIISQIEKGIEDTKLGQTVSKKLFQCTPGMVP